MKKNKIHYQPTFLLFSNSRSHVFKKNIYLILHNDTKFLTHFPQAAGVSFK